MAKRKKPKSKILFPAMVIRFGANKHEYETEGKLINLYGRDYQTIGRCRYEVGRAFRKAYRAVHGKTHKGRANA